MSDKSALAVMQGRTKLNLPWQRRSNGTWYVSAPEPGVKKTLEVAQCDCGTPELWEVRYGGSKISSSYLEKGHWVRHHYNLENAMLAGEAYLWEQVNVSMRGCQKELAELGALRALLATKS